MQRDRESHLSVRHPRHRIAVAAAILATACSSSSGTPATPAESSPEAADTPAVLDSATLREKAAAHFGALRDGSTSMLALVLDPALHAKSFDLRWQLEAAIDHHQPIAELGELGIHAAENGTYSVDLAEFPEWQPLEERMSVLLSPLALEHTLGDLRARGFRRSDINTFIAYLRDHPAISAAAASTAPASAYVESRRSAEDLRRWAAGVLGVLDPQRQRVLESTLMERLVVKTLVPQPVHE